jgi:hypothetical protein
LGWKWLIGLLPLEKALFDLAAIIYDPQSRAAKKLRHVNWQKENESIKLWHTVGTIIGSGDIQTASEHRQQKFVSLFKLRVAWLNQLYNDLIIFHDH